jgi:NAD(P)-dependent dehydrogenase (short-subunit alcohol dehydrogenase family)
MDYRIKGKCAFIGAGAHGIGEATADLLTQEGASVIVADRDEAALQQKAPRWTSVVAADLATADGVEHATSYVLATFGRAPDILVNNLGVGNSASFEELSDERWAQSFEINLMGCIRTCRTLLPRMAELGGGTVVNTSYGVDKDAALKRFLEDRHMPLGIGQPEDVAHAIVFLASPPAKYITGASLDIGGTLRGLI